MKKITKTITIVIVGIAALVAGISQIPNINGTSPSEAQIPISGEGTLAEQRAAVLESGVIPDDYLILKTGDVWETHLTPEEIAKFERVFIDSQSYGIDTKRRALGIPLSLIGENFVTLTERPGTQFDKVAALVLQGKILDGTYVVPTNEAIQRYHTYILDLYADDLPNTIQGADDRLIELIGEMAPLAHIVLDLHEQQAEMGVVPFELYEENPEYWRAVLSLFECEYNEEEDCSRDRHELEHQLRREATNPEEWGSHTWKDGTYEAQYHIMFEDCKFHMGKTGEYSSNITIDITMTCTSDRVRGVVETEGNETVTFRSKASDFEWGPVGLDTCNLSILYRNYSEDYSDWFLTHLNCHR